MGWLWSLLDHPQCLVDICKCWVAVAKWILYLLTRLSILMALIISLLLSFLWWIGARSRMNSIIVLLLMLKVLIVHDKVFWELELCNDIFAELINRKIFRNFDDAVYGAGLASLMIGLRPCLHLLCRVCIIRWAWGDTWANKGLKIPQPLFSRRIVLSQLWGVLLLLLLLSWKFISQNFTRCRVFSYSSTWAIIKAAWTTKILLNGSIIQVSHGGTWGKFVVVIRMIKTSETFARTTT